MKEPFHQGADHRDDQGTGGRNADGGGFIPDMVGSQQGGDEIASPELIAGMEGAVTRLLADGAYGGSGITHCLEKAFGADAEIIIPPPKTAVLGLGLKQDAQVEHIAAHGRMAWQS